MQNKLIQARKVAKTSTEYKLNITGLYTKHNVNNNNAIICTVMYWNAIRNKSQHLYNTSTNIKKIYNLIVKHFLIQIFSFNQISLSLNLSFIIF